MFAKLKSGFCFDWRQRDCCNLPYKWLLIENRWERESMALFKEILEIIVAPLKLSQGIKQSRQWDNKFRTQIT